MNEKMYLVLSVRDIRRMLKVASRKAHAAGKSGRNAGNHCIVLDGIEAKAVASDGSNIRSKDGQLQICSTSLAHAVRRVEEAL